MKGNKMKHWVYGEDETELPTEAFFAEIKAVFKKYNLSISHEDGYGAFIIEPFSQFNFEWLCRAQIDHEAARNIRELDRTSEPVCKECFGYGGFHSDNCSKLEE
jgi:hypothetical protein